LPDEVDVIGHNDKAVEFEPFAKPEAVEGIEDDALDDIALENMKIVNCFSGDKVEIVGIEVGLPGCHDATFCHSCFYYCCLGLTNPGLSCGMCQSCRAELFMLCRTARSGFSCRIDKSCRAELFMLCRTAKSGFFAGFGSPTERRITD
jgi:hypothetical protein